MYSKVTGFKIYYKHDNIPIFNVTVIMFKDVVDSVMVLNEEHCKRKCN